MGGWRFIHSGDKDRLGHFVADAIADTQRSSEGLLDRYQQALNKQIDAVGSVEKLSKEGELTREQLKAALNALVNDESTDVPRGSVAQVANAFTRAAQAEEDPDERQKVQSVGTLALVRL